MDVRKNVKRISAKLSAKIFKQIFAKFSKWISAKYFKWDFNIFGWATPRASIFLVTIKSDIEEKILYP